MPNFLTQIRDLDSTNPPVGYTATEPRRVRRQRLRDAAKINRSVGAASAKRQRVPPAKLIKTAIDACLQADKLGTPSNADNINSPNLKNRLGEFMYAHTRMIQTST